MPQRATRRLRKLHLQRLEARQLMAADVPLIASDGSAIAEVYHAADVNHDGLVTTTDALQVINFLSRQATERQPKLEQFFLLEDRVSPEDYVSVEDHAYDVNADRIVSPRDALQIINLLNVQASLSGPTIKTLTRLPSATGQFDFRLEGFASPQSTIHVLQNGSDDLGGVSVDVLGQWSLEVTDVALAQGRFEFQAKQVTGGGVPDQLSVPVSHQPNIVLVNADDMRKEQTQFMPFLTSIRDEMTVFENFYVPTAVSGPSRASLLSGMFAAGHGYLNNTPTMGTTLNEDKTDVLPRWMSDAGYRTGLFGKDRTQASVERQFESQDILQDVAGWDDYFAEAGGGNNAFGADYTDNGILIQSGEDEHNTDILRDQTLEFFEQTPRDVPFFAYVPTHAPHGPGVPNTRHRGLLADFEIPRKPSYAPTPEQLADVGFVELMDSQYIGGSEALFGVDEAIEAMFDRLDQLGELDNTIFIFTADNGQGLGEHGVFRKGNFLQESVNVPLWIWDGRDPVGQTTDSLATMPDLTGTVLDFAAANPSEPINGQSLLPVLEDISAEVRQDFLIQHVYNVSPTELQFEFGVHTGDTVYVELQEPFQSQTRFLFDLQADPFQLNNLIDDPGSATLLSELDARLEVLRGPDREAPSMQNLRWELSGDQYDQPQSLRLIGTVDDRATGGSEVRTPSVNARIFQTFTQGDPMEATDGVFDSAFEEVALSFDIADLRAAGTNNSFFLSTRDIIGNLSPPQAIELPFVSPMKLAAESDTGLSNQDQITLDSTPTFVGTGTPGERVAVFKAGTDNELAGTTIVDASGQWNLTVELDRPGQFTFFAQVASPASAAEPNLRLLSPLQMHLLAVRAGNQIRVDGTNDDDVILIDETADGSLQFSLNAIDAGQLGPTGRLLVNGRGGDDHLQVNGSTPSRLIGSTGDDVLIGGSGSDILFGGRGSNYAAGGDGDDVYQFIFLDRQLLAERTLPDVRDVVVERPGEGNDQFRFDGSFKINAHMGLSEPDPRLVLRTEFAYSRVVEVSDATSIERIYGADEPSVYLLPQSTLLLGGSANDTFRRSNAAAPNTWIKLGSLASGGEDLEMIDFQLVTSAGTLVVDQSLQPDVSLVFANDNRVRLNGPRSEINRSLQRGDIRLRTDSAEPSTAIVRATSYELSQPTVSQVDRLIVPVADSISLTGSSSVTHVEFGRASQIAQDVVLNTSRTEFADAQLRVAFTGDMSDRDFLPILAQVPGPGRISQQADELRYGDSLIANVLSTGIGQRSLQIQLTDQADATSIEALMRRLGYRHLSNDPGSASRQLRMTLLTSDGSHADLVVTVNIDLINQRPVLDNRGFDTVSYQTPGKVFGAGGGIIASDAENQWNGAILRINLQRPPTAGEQLRLVEGRIADSPFYTFDDATGQVFAGRFFVAQFHRMDIGTLEFQFNENADAAIVREMLRRTRYRNADASSNLSRQTIQFELTDALGEVSDVVLRHIEFA